LGECRHCVVEAFRPHNGFQCADETAITDASSPKRAVSAPVAGE
jgi:hypothetical protein